MSGSPKPPASNGAAVEKFEDFTVALNALRKISTLIAQKHADQVTHGMWALGGVAPGSTAKQVNDRIHFLRSLISAHNKTEYEEPDGRMSSPMANGATFKDVGDRGQKRRQAGWQKGMTRAQGRDAKMLSAMAQTGELDMECDRLFYGGDGQLHTVSEIDKPSKQHGL